MEESDSNTLKPKTLKIAIEGCCHGELDNIYKAIAAVESKDNIKIDLLLICGDFQAIRNETDLRCMAVPDKFKEMGTFYKYYIGEALAPMPTIIIGGNHEASNFLQELPYGGWVAPNIYYLGYAGVVNFGGIRIAGISGIFKPHHYPLGHFERPPYSENHKRSVYHVRRTEVFKLLQLQEKIDIIMSHDWPRGIEQHGDVKWLLQNKKFFAQEVANNTLGNPAHEKLLNFHKPDFWFSAHLHVKFPAVVFHDDEAKSSRMTKFLSLDKCLPRKNFLQIIDVCVPDEAPKKLFYDLEWLCVLRSTAHLDSVAEREVVLPAPGGQDRFNFVPTEAEKQEVLRLFQNNLEIPSNFQMTVAPYHPTRQDEFQNLSDFLQRSDPQTLDFAHKLQLNSPFVHAQGGAANPTDTTDSTELHLDDEEGYIRTTTTQPQAQAPNPDELNLDDFEKPEPKVTTSKTTTDPGEINLDDFGE